MVRASSAEKATVGLELQGGKGTSHVVTWGMTVPVKQTASIKAPYARVSGGFCVARVERVRGGREGSVTDVRDWEFDQFYI